MYFTHGLDTESWQKLQMCAKLYYIPLEKCYEIVLLSDVDF